MGVLLAAAICYASWPRPNRVWGRFVSLEGGLCGCTTTYQVVATSPLGAGLAALGVEAQADGTLITLKEWEQGSAYPDFTGRSIPCLGGGEVDEILLPRVVNQVESRDVRK